MLVEFIIHYYTKYGENIVLIKDSGMEYIMHYNPRGFWTITLDMAYGTSYQYGVLENGVLKRTEVGQHTYEGFLDIVYDYWIDYKQSKDYNCKLTLEQKKIELITQRYLNSLRSKRIKISSINGENSSFTKIQESFLSIIDKCISDTSTRINDINNGAVWDQLVIAFFGETNAGKSTIIETFRILFGEQERNQKIKNEGDCVDGLIVGDGHSDFTKVYKEYHLTIAGKPFTLIDVPGIEGNESDYENEIMTALNKAHYVFYVQGQNKKPDSGTVSKIKKYLREWVKVYSIYNVRGVAANYEEDEERVSLLSEGQCSIEQQIQDTFRDILGSTYMGNITLQAYLAMCSYAKFASSRNDLQRAQRKLLSYFGISKNLLEFSQFSSLIKVIEAKTKNFSEEILEANKEKNKALLHNMFISIRNESSSQNDAVSRLISDIENFEKDVEKDFSSAKDHIKIYSSQKYNQIFDEIYYNLAKAIEEGANSENYFKNLAKNIIDTQTSEIEIYVKNEVKELNNKILSRKKSLDQHLSSIYADGSANVNVNLNIGNALDKLDLSFGDVFNVILGIGGAIWAGFAAANFWNPLGWIVGAIGLIAFIFGGGRNKKAEAKEELKKAIEKARYENEPNFNNSINSITNSLQSKCNNLCSVAEIDIKNLQNIQDTIVVMQNSFKDEYSKLNSSKYGQL